ncbi:MAG: hypothetical protein U0R80_09385 [Nocardioidaceae bacterium]
MVTQTYDPGRPGPPLALGIVVLIFGPIFALMMLGRSAVAHLDVANTGPITNHGRVALNSGSTYLVATEAAQPGSQGCKVHQRNGGPVTVNPDSSVDTGTVMWGSEAFVSQGDFFLEKNGVYVVDCPKAGPQVLLIPIKGSMKELGWAMGRWLVAGGLLAVIGLLMIIFRRKKPREVRSLNGPPPPQGAWPPPGPGAPPPGPWAQPPADPWGQQPPGDTWVDPLTQPASSAPGEPWVHPGSSAPVGGGTPYGDQQPPPPPPWATPGT